MFNFFLILWFTASLLLSRDGRIGWYILKFEFLLMFILIKKGRGQLLLNFSSVFVMWGNGAFSVFGHLVVSPLEGFSDLRIFIGYMNLKFVLLEAWSIDLDVSISCLLVGGEWLRPDLQGSLVTRENHISLL